MAAAADVASVRERRALEARQDQTRKRLRPAREREPAGTGTHGLVPRDRQAPAKKPLFHGLRGAQSGTPDNARGLARAYLRRRRELLCGLCRSVFLGPSRPKKVGVRSGSPCPIPRSRLPRTLAKRAPPNGIQ